MTVNVNGNYDYREFDHLRATLLHEHCSILNVCDIAALLMCLYYILLH